jgi:hypothetical protein
LISRDTKFKAYEIQLFIRRRRENVEKLYISMIQRKKRARHCFLALQELRGVAIELRARNRQSNNASKSQAIKSFRKQSQEMKKLVRQRKRESREN